MKFNPELAKQICRDMQIKFDPEQNCVTILGEKLPNDFIAEKLFCGEYYTDEEIELISKAIKERSVDTGVSIYDYL